MKLNTKISTLFMACSSLITMSAHGQYWADETGGIYNIPAVEYNDTYTGYGSDGDLIYNKIDLQNGQTMQIIRNAPLYDHTGTVVATAWSSAIGWNHEIDFRDGGIIAATLADIKVGDTIHKMTYAWSVNTREGGRRSGWIKLTDLSPSANIENILSENKTKRMNILRDGGVEDATYTENTIISATLPEEYEEYYLDPDRDASYTAGKAKYYYTRDNYISGIKNIPETSRQRYGVAHDNIPLNGKFYRDNNHSRVNVSIYPPSSSDAVGHKLRLVWGYTITSAGEKLYSWVNERTLVSTGVIVSNNNKKIVSLRKRNATGFGIDGNHDGSNGQNVYLWSYNANNENQQWEEIDHGNGYFSYLKLDTNFALDGGNGGSSNQNVHLWAYNPSNQNQQWKKISKGGSNYQLQKRNATNFALAGGDGGSNRQNIKINTVNTTHYNQQWIITEQ